MAGVIEVLAHQGGWDEALLVATPIALFVFLLRVANQRAARLADEADASVDTSDDHIDPTGDDGDDESDDEPSPSGHHPAPDRRDI
jgi:hypothetical protein